MTDTRALLADYATTGSEDAFRELASCYFDLVYSTAVRLVDGDRHRAEDVTQTVFADLARLARTLHPRPFLLHEPPELFTADFMLIDHQRRRFCPARIGLPCARDSPCRPATQDDKSAHQTCNTTVVTDGLLASGLIRDIESNAAVDTTQ